MLQHAIPVLHVSRSKAAEAFYLRLGFQVRFAYRPFGGADPCYMGVQRDGVELHLSSFSGDGVAGGVVFIGVEDVDALHREFQAKAISIDTGPVDQDWGNREMYVKDPDRNSLRFVQPMP